MSTPSTEELLQRMQTAREGLMQAVEALVGVAKALDEPPPRDTRKASPAPEYENGICGPHPCAPGVVCILPAGHAGRHYDGTDPEVLQERFTRSATCAHDDAATPGRPERVKERSTELVATLSDASPESEDSADAIERYAESYAYERGVEAMRAACLQEVMELVPLINLSPHQKAMLKAAIEGATP